MSQSREMIREMWRMKNLLTKLCLPCRKRVMGASMNDVKRIREGVHITRSDAVAYALYHVCDDCKMLKEYKELKVN